MNPSPDENDPASRVEQDASTSLPNYPPPPYSYSLADQHEARAATQVSGPIYNDYPPQLPPLVSGQKIKSGPYIITVTDDMVANRERENRELRTAWLVDRTRRNVSDEERQQERSEIYARQFKESETRRRFIKKVYSILTLQLMITAAFIACAMYVDDLKYWMLEHWILWPIALFLYLFTYVAITCYESVRRQSPCNCVFLSLLTLSMSYVSAHMSINYKVEFVLLAFGSTAFVSLFVSLAAVFTKFDLTKRAGMMFVIGLAVTFFSVIVVVAMMFIRIKILHIVIAGMMTLFCSMYLFHDTQLLMGGRKIEISPDEYIFATTQIYVDIVMLYQYVLMCTGCISPDS